MKARSPTDVYLRARYEMIAAGAQHIPNGIHNGLVIIINIKTQKHSDNKSRSKPTCRKSSSPIMREKNQHFRIIFATSRAFLERKEVMIFKSSF